ncbi:hypothetical protein DFJ74DRAFT_683130 [Hyaloraphidium curvatum]|nr:hypothetical protein DFJ74DRAFT_683130 [Hyaloraphidium curvatum]
MPHPRVFQIQQGTAGRFPPVPVTIELSSFPRSESPSLEPSSPLVPSVSLLYGPDAGESGEFARIAANPRQWHGSAVPLPPTPRHFYANPEVQDFVAQLESQGAVKKVEGAGGHRLGDETLDLYELVEEAVAVKVVKDAGGAKTAAGGEKCALCGKKEGGSVRISKCSGCKKIGYCGADCQKRDWKAHKPKCAKA